MLLKSDRSVAFGQRRTGSQTTLRPRTFTYWSIDWGFVTFVYWPFCTDMATGLLTTFPQSKQLWLLFSQGFFFVFASQIVLNVLQITSNIMAKCTCVSLINYIITVPLTFVRKQITLRLHCTRFTAVPGCLYEMTHEHLRFVWQVVILPGL